MRVTMYTDYSLRVLMYLATLAENEKANIQDIASLFNISKNHLTKVVHQLGKLGLIHTTRGRGGGIELGEKPEKINLGWLIRQTEEDFDLVECFNKDHNTCAISSACRLKGVFHEALNNYLATFDQYSLNDITKNSNDLRHIFFQSKV